MRTYQNYHRHSMYTNTRIADSTATPQAYAARALELGQGILSSMEHGYQGRYIETYTVAKENGLKPLIGTEAYWVKDRREKDGTNCHLFLAARNESGRRALNDVLSEANITGFYRQARLDLPLILSLPPADVWVTSACLAGWKYEDADELMAQFAAHFGPNFYFEVQYHNTPEQAKLNARILRLSKALHVPLIMGCDSHYIHPADAQERTDFLFSKGIEYPEEQGWYLDMPDGDTAYARFSSQGVLTHEQIEEAMRNTNIFLEVEEYDSPVFNRDIKMPSLYPHLTQAERDREYERLVWEGWAGYKSHVPRERHREYEREIQKEIDVVRETKMADYFILDHAIVQRGREKGGWLTSTGRGSGPSFLTNMLLGFTEVDRVAASVRMYPERFMSAKRILESGSLPDLDLNCYPVAPFAAAQQEILGREHAWPMIAFGTMQASAAWKLYAKSQGIPFETANAVSAQIQSYENALNRADEDERDTIDPHNYVRPCYHELFDRSGIYRGIITSWSIAPCGYLLYSGDIRKEIGLIRVKDNLCCLMDGHWAEDGHFLKNDLLAVQVVGLIQRSFHRAGLNVPRVRELLAMCPPEDPCWGIYAKGCTIGVNQCEQPGTSARVGVYKPRNISELAAFVAAIRPGFQSMYKVFESRRPFRYYITAFDSLMQTPEMPNSFCLYQEQEMAALHYAGIDLSDCYTAIKNIAKKRKDKVLAYRETFVGGFRDAIVRDEGKSADEATMLAEQLWKIIEDSARYSFNASHAYCVALDSLYIAWIKAHHPLAFYETYLSMQEERGEKDKMAAAKDEAESYYSIRFPPLRYGQDNRAVRADKDARVITFPLHAIKRFGPRVGEIMFECAQNEFGSFMQILVWLRERGVTLTYVRPLIAIDYFARFGSIPTLSAIADRFEWIKLGTSKRLRRDGVPEDIRPIVERFASGVNAKGNVLATHAITDMAGLLEALEAHERAQNRPALSYKERADLQLEVLGYVDLTTGDPADLQKLYLLNVYPLKSKRDDEIWTYKLKTKSLGSGKTASLDLKPLQFARQPVEKGDIVLARQIHKNKRGYWILDEYEVIR